MGKETKDEKPNPFKVAVESTPEVSNGYRKGLQALKSADKNAIRVQKNNARKLDGSLDIDGNTADLYPEESRWDYAIGYNSMVYYVEVHPANTSTVDEMLKKKVWLQTWLKKKAPLLDCYPSKPEKYIWIATAAGVHILPGSAEYRKASQKNLIPRKILVLED